VGDWQNIAVVGEPIAFGIGFLVLVLVAFTGGWADSIVTVAHEGGHMVALLLSGRGVKGFKLTEGNEVTNGATTPTNGGGASDIFVAFAGYATPPLAGLGGAYVIADGNAWGVVVVGVILLIAVLLVPEMNALALVVVVLLLAGFIWALIAGGPGIQAAIAVGLVWLLLIGGLHRVLVDKYNASDAHRLADDTWIPRMVWFAGWLVIAVVSLWDGGRVLLGYT
jgi:Peptidase M50B-like